MGFQGGSDDKLPLLEWAGEKKATFLAEIDEKEEEISFRITNKDNGYAPGFLPAGWQGNIMYRLIANKACASKYELTNANGMIKKDASAVIKVKRKAKNPLKASDSFTFTCIRSVKDEPYDNDTWAGSAGSESFVVPVQVKPNPEAAAKKKAAMEAKKKAAEEAKRKKEEEEARLEEERKAREEEERRKEEVRLAEEAEAKRKAEEKEAERVRKEAEAAEEARLKAEALAKQKAEEEQMENARKAAELAESEAEERRKQAEVERKRIEAEKAASLFACCASPNKGEDLPG